MTDCPTAFGAPRVRGVLRHQPEDFRVTEQLGFEPGGEGEHLWLYLRKRGWNTLDLAQWLARAAGLRLGQVGYSGLKDRHAVTEQWFSLHLPGRADPQFDWPDGVEALRLVRHGRKLNRGTHRANHFQLVVRELTGDLDEIAPRLESLASRGVPNYFGVQRFGRQARNPAHARAWLLGDGEPPRKKAMRGIWLSALRSELFNAVLAERVRRDCWDTLLEGDILQPDGSRGLFAEQDEPAARERLAAGEVHPTAPLPGRGGMASSRACAALEQHVLAPDQPVIEALAAEGVDAARRATRLPVRGLTWHCEQQELHLDMTLPTGAFATTVLAELIAEPVM